ncbi:hypothetical protein HELRODRAFT_183998 [Helobdella robusta]|uniref:Methyltransferase FkbM domain-containing protein n=1 Tax=Helobdella robusta TaxID=6412 RepID=T1FKE5_HELRO|nr:hypothetical protein HELRODRAFT_183998 [Helobdella robusta]ESO09636.1 hypothetical protein HELRODRAFT_183998 [Helobdella robusta]
MKNVLTMLMLVVVVIMIVAYCVDRYGAIRQMKFIHEAEKNFEENYRKTKLKVHLPPQNKGRPKLRSYNHRSWPQTGTPYIIDKLLRNKTNGFFIECGAADGETQSNTLFFEVLRNWTGLLIEANDDSFATLLTKNRNVYAYHGCLSTSKIVADYQFVPIFLTGGIGKSYDKTHPKNWNKAQTKECIPLSYLFHHLNITHVDYFSLDTEGSELEILKTLDFNEVRIDILGVEYAIYLGDPAEMEEKRQRLVKFFEETNLYYRTNISHSQDEFFYRKDFNIGN